MRKTVGISVGRCYSDGSGRERKCKRVQISVDKRRLDILES